MAGLFAKAAAKKSETAPKTKKQTVWLVGEGDKVGVAVKSLIELTAVAKATEAKMTVHKQVVKEFADEKFVNEYAASGVSPETPLLVQNADGEKVTFVVQDRSSQYQVKDDQREALEALLGSDRAADLLYTDTTFGFNRDVLALPGVQEVIEKALEGAVRKLVDDKDGKPILTPEQAELLLDVKSKTAFKPGTLDRLALICGKDTVKIEQFLNIMGSSATRYVKV